MDAIPLFIFISVIITIYLIVGVDMFWALFMILRNCAGRLFKKKSE